MESSGITTKKRSMEQYINSIRKILSAVGGTDPRHNRLGKLDFRLV